MIEKNQKTVAILQPGYLPWLGFFEQLYRCDIFVFLDDVQFTKNDWRNRNRIRTKEGTQWLTIPVIYKFGQKINEILIDNQSRWQRKHLQALRTWYGKSKYWNDFAGDLEKIYLKDWKYLVDIDIELVLWLKNALGVSCQITRSSELNALSIDRQCRLVEVCQLLKCDRFYEGKSGQNYMDIELFKDNGITVEFQSYQHPYYNQLWIKEQGFISHLSVVDLLFNHGPESLAILTGHKIIPQPDGIRIHHADAFKK